jgi:hypothetical protein
LISAFEGLARANILSLKALLTYSASFFGSSVRSRMKPSLCRETEELRPDQLEEALIRGDIDYAITYIPIPHPDLDFHEITKSKMVISGRKVFLKIKISMSWIL